MIAPTQASPAQSLRILVVDDHRDGNEAMVLLLTLSGHQARACFDGPSALAEVERWQPDAILLDLGLPGMNGYEVAARLRAMTSKHAPFLIAVTGLGRVEDRQRSAQAGIDLHLLKPADPAGLLEVLERLRDLDPVA
jgi:CheY-like chemotaxis protein